jgi:pimeloyl-ACP methyl ester carboxylesterase
MKRSLVLTVPFTVAFLGLFPACSDGNPTTTAGSGGAAGADVPITWGECPADSAYTLSPGVECATINMPVDHDKPQGETIPYFLARRLSDTPHKKQLWLLNGGPGSGDEEFFYGITDSIVASAPGVDIYAPDHRGTGRSSPLTCTGEAAGSPRDVELSPEEWTSCIAEMKTKWGDKLGFFNVTQAAKDVGSLIDRTREPGEQVFVYGLSYGTYLVWRYLSLFPGQADGVIQDSIVSPGLIYQSKADQYFDPVLKDVAELCKTDAGCMAKMGPDPYAKVQAVFTALDAGHCAESGFNRALLRQSIGRFLFGWNARITSLALPYRLDRCDAADVTALKTFVTAVFQPLGDLGGFSHALESNISFSEIWENPAPSANEIRARAEAVMSGLDWAYERADVYDAWPKYPADQYQLAWPKTDKPMLMLNGTLDTETPLDTALVASMHYNGPHQTFVQIPKGPHAVGLVSPTTLPDGIPCGIAILGSFVTNPLAPPDTSCIASLKPFLFEYAKIAPAIFGSSSLWENVAPLPAHVSVDSKKSAHHKVKRSRWFGVAQSIDSTDGANRLQ